MDRGAWLATARGVTQSHTWLKWLTAHAPSYCSPWGCTSLTSTGSAGGFPFLHTFYCLKNFWCWTFWHMWGDTSWQFLICISLIISKVEHLFMWLLHICISSLETCLCRSSAYFWLDYLFFGYWTTWVFCANFGDESLVICIACKYFLPSVGSLFILFMVSFAVHKLLGLLQSFLLICITIADRSKKILL